MYFIFIFSNFQYGRSTRCHLIYVCVYIISFLLLLYIKPPHLTISLCFFSLHNHTIHTNSIINLSSFHFLSLQYGLWLTADHRRMSHACAAVDSAISSDGDSLAAGAGEIMLFGVRVVVDSMRKSVSMNNLSQYEHPQDNNSGNNKENALAATGYASADDAAAHNSGRHRERERKRGMIWLISFLWSMIGFSFILTDFVCLFVCFDFWYERKWLI